MITNLIPSAIVEALGWSLVHCLWQLTLVAIVFALIRKHFASSRARYNLGVVAMLACAFLPAITFVMYATDNQSDVASDLVVNGFSDVTAMETELVSGTTPALAPVVSHTVDFIEEVPEDIDGPHLREIGATTSTFGASSSLDWMERKFPILITAWLIGVGLFSLRPFASFFTVLRLGKDGSPFDSRLEELLVRSCRQMKVSISVKGLISERVNVPMVVGFFKPVILVPTSMLTCLSPTEIEAILRHELAHVVRLDAFANLIQIAIETLLFFHPAVWWISRNVRAERENCCDDLATELPGMTHALATALFRLEESHIANTALAATGGTLKTRIQRLLEPERQQRQPFAFRRIGLMQIALLTTIAAISILATQPYRTDFNDSEMSNLAAASTLSIDNEKVVVFDEDEERLKQQLDQLITRLAPFNQDSDSTGFCSADYMLAARVLLKLPGKKRSEVLRSWCGEHDEQVIILCRMLFQAKKDGNFRRPHVGGFVGPGKSQDWPLEPIAIVDEVPFLVAYGYTLAGQAEPADSYLRYCTEFCDWTNRTYTSSDIRSIKASMRKILASVDDAKDEGRVRFKQFLVPQLSGKPASTVAIKAADFVASRLADDGKWSNTRFSAYKGGPESLCTLALLRSHLMFDDKVSQAVNEVAKSNVVGTYSLSLQAIALCEADPVVHVNKIKDNIKELVRLQNRTGGWSYGRTATKGTADGSNTRFAIWALHVANQHGFEVEKATWQKSASYWLESQLDDGGWGYHPQSKPARRYSMSLSGICCLSMCLKSGKLDAETKAKIESAIVRGWDRRNHDRAMKGQWPAYGANVYSLACSVTDRKLPGLNLSQIHTQNWFDKELERNQTFSGAFDFERSVVDDAIQASLAVIALTE